MRVDVTCRNADDDGGDAVPRAMDRARVRSAAASHGKLDGDARLPGDGLDETHQPPVGDRRRIEEPDLRSRAQDRLALALTR